MRRNTRPGCRRRSPGLIRTSRAPRPRAPAAASAGVPGRAEPARRRRSRIRGPCSTDCGGRTHS
ncbi:MAG: hypothetical protein EHM60_01080 [Lysobacterales bacterium]|nr:MAG: hypothetical protein EHM60_01080 [Xanthomonadales bacterium]